MLVAPRVVLTAAHCLPLGVDRIQFGHRIGHGRQARVIETHVHPSYSEDLVPSNDIAVLVLDHDAPEAAAPVASKAACDEGDNLHLVGFGYSDPELAIGFGTKREVNVVMAPPSTLSAEEERIAEWKHGYEADHELFAGRRGLGKDSCNGDSGGPAYIRVNNGWMLAGLTSRASYDAVARCGDGGIYTRITPYRDWVEAASRGLYRNPRGAVTELRSRDESETPRLYSALPNPQGRDDGCEWVEIINEANEDVRLDGLELADDDGGVQGLGHGRLVAGRRHRVVLDPSQLRLGNSGDRLQLRRGGTVLSSVQWGPAASGDVVYFSGDGDMSDPPMSKPPSPDAPTSPFSFADPC